MSTLTGKSRPSGAHPHLQPKRSLFALLPLPGRPIDLTKDHARVAAALRGLRGTSDAPLFRHYLTLAEAEAYERNDKRAIAEVVERECARDVETRRAASGLPPVCPTDLEHDAAERLGYERRHIEMVLTNLLNLAGQLRHVVAPTTILLISGGLGFDQQSLARFGQVQEALKQAGVAIYSVQVHQPEMDASVARPANGSLYSPRDRDTGLANVATMAGGAFFAGVGRAAGVFERLRTELTETYELGVEAQPGDFDGMPHELKITSSRGGAVRAKRYVTRAAPSANWAARLATLIEQPVDIADLPIAAAAYCLRGDETATLKVLVRADIGKGLKTTVPVRYAMTVIGQDGSAILNLTGTAATDGSLLAAIQLAPGRYRVRIAALEAGGRAGVLELPIVAGMRVAGGLQLSDVLVSPSRETTLAPAISLDAGDPLASALEVSTDDAATFRRASVGFEVRRAGRDAIVTTGDGQFQETAYDRQQIARATISTVDLEPGAYTVSAIVKLDGQPAAKVSRMVVLEPRSSPPPAAPPPPSPAPPVTAAADAPKVEADPILQGVLNRVASYVAAYGQQLAAVVAVEKYTQHVNPVGTTSARPRELLAEFALVKSAGSVPWVGYRDVIAVNGEPVHDRRDRLLRILTESSNPLEEAARLTAESSRFNVGPVSRNFNVPTTALFFFTEANLVRFAFTRKGIKKIDGVDAMEVAFRETARPTLVTTRAGQNVPSRGTLWVRPGDGTIVRTRLQLSGFADSVAMTAPRDPGVRVQPAPQPSAGTVSTPAPAQPPSTGSSGAPAASGSPAGGAQRATTGGAQGSTAGDAHSNVGGGSFMSMPEMSMSELESTAEIEVTYQRDERLGMWLPARMSEEYQGAIPRPNSSPVLGISRSNATYTDYKRFGTSTTITGPQK